MAPKTPQVNPSLFGGAGEGGGDPGKGTPMKKPRGESLGYVFRIDRLLAEAETKPPREDTSSEDGDVKAGAYNEGSNKDKAVASAARRSYMASGTANNPKATVFAVRRARTARAAVSTTEAHDVGANGDEAAASNARRAYAASGTANNPKATASAGRCARTARVAIRKTEAHGEGMVQAWVGQKLVKRDI